MDGDKSDVWMVGVSDRGSFVGVIEGDCVIIGVDSSLKFSPVFDMRVEFCEWVGFSAKDACVGKAALPEKVLFLTVLFNWQALIDRSKANTKILFISKPPI
jgi:hypothetical protein